MGVARLGVEPKANKSVIIMRLVELECYSFRFGDVTECVFGTKLVCTTTPYDGHKCFWCKRLGLGSSSKQKAFAFMIFRCVAFCAKRD